MHYYQFNIGDYASHTSRLSPMEDLAYRRLLDLYYLNEQPLCGCSTDVAREIGLADHELSVKYVLAKFFTFENDCYKQKRIDIEIKKYQSNQKNKKKAGVASAKARLAKAKERLAGVEQVLNRASTDEQRNINQEPRTNNHKPITNLKDKQVSDRKRSDVPYETIRKLYNSILASDKDLEYRLGETVKLTTKRKTAIKKYWGREGKSGIDAVRAYFQWIFDSRENHRWIYGHSERGWVADLEYLLREETVVKCIEGTL